MQEQGEEVQEPGGGVARITQGMETSHPWREEYVGTFLCTLLLI